MHDSGTSGLDELQGALAARATVQGWAEGLELLELFRAAHRAGWLDLLRRGTTTAELADATGVPAEQAADVLAVLTAAGVAHEQDTAFRLTPAFHALIAGASGVDVPTVLDAADLARDRVAGAVLPADRDLDGEQALRLARGWGVRPEDGARQLYRMLYQALPEYHDRLARGGPLLDVGSGVGGALLTTLTLFDGLRAVGVEVVPEVAAELTARAADAGVADRLDVRTTDARELRDENAFEVCYWAQAFFPADDRADVLAAIRRALRPGGLLLVQELFPAQADPGTRGALDRLFHRRQRVAFGVSAEDLAAEGTAAGFRAPQIIASPLGRLVLLRTP
ncbi:class I SAM-dependent methyltransferase [Saccharopolyspora sp. NPDC047091]|uniref:SAM-dependent methyltransferase n=1 Tax=Saccharopolyspora sp. NPDC047091 TaxID=3155924 RepID=UPI0033F2A244